MIFHNAAVLCDDFLFHKTSLSLHETIEQIGETAESGYDLSGLYVVPAFLDVHTHGIMGQDMMTAKDIPAYLRSMYQNGVLNFLPTTCAASHNDTKKALSTWKDVDAACGIHLEGPFLNRDKCGAQDPETIIESDLSLLDEWIRASGEKVRLITVAPEVGRNLEFISAAKARGIFVSLGHSTCDYSTAKTAFENGADHITHLFNAMNPLNHRNSGLVGAALDLDFYCEVIGDGIHLSPEIVRMVYRVKGAEKMILISDSMAATGLSDGRYCLGSGTDVFVRDGVAKTPDGTIAGSTSTVYKNVKNAVSFGIPLEEAVRMASLTPAKSVGLEKEIGSIAIGKFADLVVLDPSLTIVACIKRGKIVYGGLEQKE